jgi:hypothetical protein
MYNESLYNSIKLEHLAFNRMRRDDVAREEARIKNALRSR